MKNILLILFIILSCCKQEKSKISNSNFSSKKVDSILNSKDTNQFPIIINHLNKKLQLEVISFGKKGMFGSIYSDGELDSPVFYLRTVLKGKVIDSIEIHKKVIGENLYKTKLFKILNNSKLKVETTEKWEDIETGLIEKTDSLHTYILYGNGKIIRLK
jgi:hypothetical protein